MAEYTSFSEVYDSFLNKVTDDMYMELTPEETEDMLQALLLNSLSWFEFPKVNIFDYNADAAEFNVTLSNEEINILATYMAAEWMGQQLATVQNIRQQYSGADFKMTAQANHMDKILKIKDSYESKGFHLQRLYKRRHINDDGKVVSSLGSIMEVD